MVGFLCLMPHSSMESDSSCKEMQQCCLTGFLDCCIWTHLWVLRGEDFYPSLFVWFQRKWLNWVQTFWWEVSSGGGETGQSSISWTLVKHPIQSVTPVLTSTSGLCRRIWTNGILWFRYGSGGKKQSVTGFLVAVEQPVELILDRSRQISIWTYLRIQVLSRLLFYRNTWNFRRRSLQKRHLMVQETTIKIRPILLERRL